MASEHLPFLARLKKRDQDVDDVWRDAQIVREMLTSSGFQLVEDLIEEAHGEAVTRLLFAHTGSDGRVFDQAEYARLLGFLSGLRQFRWAAEAFTEHAERVRRKENSDV